ncbi:hypothetical protein FXO38_24017 [Capsicum annuum]|nr:hypothetical protein FXO38_24017 [Capsicum annuum]
MADRLISILSIQETMADRLSELLICLRTYLFSFLDMKTLVRTSLLSSSNRFLCRDMKSLKVIFSGPQINVFLYHRLVGNYIAAIHGVDLSNIEIDFTCGLYYDLIRNIEGWLRDHTAQVKILKLNLEEEGSLDQVLYRISFPFAVRTSRTLVHLSLSTSRHIRLITLSQHWDVPTLKEVSLCGFSLNGEDGVIGGCHNIERLTLQSCCYGGPNEIMKLVLNKLWVLKIEDWNYRGNHSKFSVNVDAPLLIDLILVKHSSNLMFARPMNLKFVMFSLKKYRVNGWTFGNTILNMLDQLRTETLRVSTGCCQEGGS